MRDQGVDLARRKSGVLRYRLGLGLRDHLQPFFRAARDLLLHRCRYRRIGADAVLEPGRKPGEQDGADQSRTERLAEVLRCALHAAGLARARLGHRRHHNVAELRDHEADAWPTAALARAAVARTGVYRRPPYAASP